MINEEEKNEKMDDGSMFADRRGVCLCGLRPAAETASQAPESSTEPGEASVESSTEASAGTKRRAAVNMR